MTVPAAPSANHGNRTRRRYGLAVVAVGIGLASATGHDVAWADTGDSGSSENTSVHSSSGPVSGPKKSAHDGGSDQSGSPTKKTRPASGAASIDIGATSAAPQQESSSAHRKTSARAPKLTGPTRIESAESTEPESLAYPATVSTLSPRRAARTHAAAATPTSTTVTPSDPEPLSPIAEIAALPGRIVNTVLQVLDLTVTADEPPSPLNFAPIDEALFAAFRRIEGALGLDDTPPVVLVPPTEIYTGPTTTATPTVEQFLNAAAAGYVLGGTPGGMKPFTVDGVQITSTNILSGESAQVWVTPQKQIIIAYQGTTGGTNLLFNPLIAVSQIVTDTQIIFTDTTPQAFHDALAFEQQVEAAAAEQGYSKSDIFVTGHSLGGWEAEYVAQQTGLGGIGFESPGINTTVPGNGVNSGFLNVETYGDPAAYFATDLPGLQPFMPAYVPGGGSKPHYGSIVMIGDPAAMFPLINASSLWGSNLVGDLIFAVDLLGNFVEHHLPGMQAYNLGVSPDPGVVPWLGSTMGPVNDGWGDLTIPELALAASAAGVLFTP
ncbi:hypothetical protein BH09ACT7_BH09ACT7_35730 [soil metagenome]